LSLGRQPKFPARVRQPVGETAAPDETPGEGISYLSPFSNFLQGLFRDGSAVLSGPPILGPSDAAAAKLLASAYADHCLDVAGSPPSFDPTTAAAVAGRVWCACWFLVHSGDGPDVVDRVLALPPPTNAAQHLSADLTLRFLPQVHRRARALAAADSLTAGLARLLRQWPLSGVLSDVTEPPATPPEFDGHKGLLMLYADRLVANPKPAWTPTGPGLPHVELAFAYRGLSVPAVAVAKAALLE
jgi:MoxR-vWA-beta-propeller ternary system domain bpX4